MTFADVYVFAIETIEVVTPDATSVLLVSIFATPAKDVVPIPVAIPLKLYETVDKS